MKLKLIVLLLSLIPSFMVAPLFAQQQETLRVMTWNIRLDTPDDGPNQWQYRKDGLCDEIKKLHPDILGVQEALYNQMKDMRKGLKGYKSIGVGRDDGKNRGEFSALFFNKIELSLVRSGTFWLSETPDIAGSRGWDAACNRIVTWAEFIDKTSGKHFISMNTHFDHMGEQARVESAKFILVKINELAHQLPVILTGDFNITNKHRAYRILTFSENEYVLSDTRERPGIIKNGPDCSYIGFPHSGEPEELIDFILATWDFKVISSTTIDFRSGDKYLSDHLPIISELQLN